MFYFLIPDYKKASRECIALGVNLLVLYSFLASNHLKLGLKSSKFENGVDSGPC